MNTQDQLIETYTGLRIFLNEDEGYYANNGPDGFGFCERIDDLKTDIDEYWLGTEHGEANGFFYN